MQFIHNDAVEEQSRSLFGCSFQISKVSKIQTGYMRAVIGSGISGHPASATTSKTVSELTGIQSFLAKALSSPCFSPGVLLSDFRDVQLAHLASFPPTLGL